MWTEYSVSGVRSANSVCNVSGKISVENERNSVYHLFRFSLDLLQTEYKYKQFSNSKNSNLSGNNSDNKQNPQINRPAFRKYHHFDV